MARVRGRGEGGGGTHDIASRGYMTLVGGI